jgi:hypothetical protein
MIDYETLAGDLRAIAEGAEPGITDLSDVVNRRYVRRRRIRTGASAVAGVFAVMIGIAASIPAAEHARQPAHGNHGSSQGWHVPSTGATLPSLASTWPRAVVHFPVHAPDGGTPVAVADIDKTHVLAGSEPTPGIATALYAFDTTNDTFRLITTVPQGHDPAAVTNWAVSTHSVVWGIDAEPLSVDVYTAPLAGGPARKIAHFAGRTVLLGPWFATDDAVYWSSGQPGVMRLPLSGGSPEPVAGFQEMYLLHGTSPWAARLDDVQASKFGDTSPYGITIGGQRSKDPRPGVTRQLKNIVTGAEIDVSVPADAWTLSCTPVFCVGSVATGDDGLSWFIQRPDGKNRVALHSDGMDGYFVAEAGLLGHTFGSISENGVPMSNLLVFCDPVDGTAGQTVWAVPYGPAVAALGLADAPQSRVSAYFLFNLTD